jgi:hypothetical protein
VAGFVDDLRLAQQRQVMVVVTLADGQRLETGVHEIDEEGGTVTFYAPQYQGDLATQRVWLNDITSTALTDIHYPV